MLLDSQFNKLCRTVLQLNQPRLRHCNLPTFSLYRHLAWRPPPAKNFSRASWASAASVNVGSPNPQMYARYNFYAAPFLAPAPSPSIASLRRKTTFGNNPPSHPDPNWQVYDGRGWQLTPSGNQHLQRPLPGLEFSLMSYNVLSQHLMVDHPHLYQQCPPSALDWTQRGQALLAQIHSNSPDIACLQEVDETHYNEFFLPQLVQMGYQCSYKKRTRSKKDGCALIFKSDKFELENLVNVEFYKDEVNLLGRDNVGMIGVLRHKHMLGKQSRLLVATTHLLFNPARGDIKLAQLLVLLAEIHQLALKSPGGSNYHPVLLCGDFNSEPLSPLYKFISSGNLALDDLKCSEISGQSKFPWKGKPLQKDQLINKDIGISLNSRYENNQGPSQTLLKACQDSDEPIPPLEQNVLKHNFKFVSAYNHMDSLGQPEISTYHANAACTVDYIFYSVAERTTQYQYGRPILSHLQPGELTHLASYSLPSQTQLQPQGTLPNLIHPSDHLPLISRFIWNPTS